MHKNEVTAEPIRVLAPRGAFPVHKRSVRYFLGTMHPTTTLCFTVVIVSHPAWSGFQVDAAGWFTPQYPPVVEFGQYNPSDQICFHKKVLDGTNSPQIIHFRHVISLF